MVRINLVNPKKLADQHLIAEYNEILMLIGHTKKFPKIKNQPKSYCLGSGHITFFKDKLKYLKSRHAIIKKEMKNRGFAPKKTINLAIFPKQLKNNWHPKKQDFKIIKKRLIEKIKLKPYFYTYRKKHKNIEFFIELLA
jgi:deoxyribonuclease (pyrimidine dimer)